jgi:hypothetical protein
MTEQHAAIRKPHKSPPLKAAEETNTQDDVLPPPTPDEWFPVEELQPAADMEIMVRASKKGNPFRVKFKRTRAYNHEAMRYLPFLLMVDAATNLRLTFKPIEWQPVQKVAEAAE